MNIKYFLYLHFAYGDLSAMLEFNKTAAMWKWSPLFNFQGTAIEI